MKAYKQYLTETLQNFFEAIEQTLTSLIGYKDSSKPGVKIIRIYSDNFYDTDEKEDFDNPDFLDGYIFVNKADKSINVIQKINLTKIANTTKLTLDEVKEEVKDFISTALYYFDVRIGGQTGTNVGKGGYVRMIGHEVGKDYRGYYTLDKIMNETIETKGDIYLVTDLLLKLKESTSTEDEPSGRVNVKKSKSLKIGAGKEDDDEQTEPEVEPSEQELAMAASELETKED